MQMLCSGWYATCQVRRWLGRRCKVRSHRYESEYVDGFTCAFGRLAGWQRGSVYVLDSNGPGHGCARDRCFSTVGHLQLPASGGPTGFMWKCKRKRCRASAVRPSIEVGLGVPGAAADSARSVRCGVGHTGEEMGDHKTMNDISIATGKRWGTLPRRAMTDMARGATEEQARRWRDLCMTKP